MTRKQAGRLGGLATAQKYGRNYMSRIGKRGAETFWRLYKLTPVGLSYFAIVRREDGIVIGFTNGGAR